MATYRHAKFSVSNFSGSPLHWKGDDVKHGKYDTAPPKTIDLTARFEVSTRDNALIGPEGSCTYTGETGKGTFEVTFYWHHPFGAGTSNYSASVNNDHASASADPTTETGHTQSISYYVKPGPA